MLWEAAEALAGRPLPSPFWAYPWPGGAALARLLLDAPARVRGRRVLEIGCGGGMAALAAARCGAARVVANDVDPWALAVAGIAARRQELRLETLQADLAAEGAWPPACGGPREATAGARRVSGAACGVGEAAAFEVVLCGDVAYERAGAPRVRALLAAALAAGAEVLLADPGRRYFDARGLREVACWTVGVPRDLEGTERRTARVYELLRGDEPV